MANKKIKCSFCGKSKDDVLLMMNGINADVYACNECVSAMYDMVLDMEDEADFENTAEEIKMSTPSEIKKHLDMYVIGQDKAKITLSVAIYNHYKRILYKDRNKKDDVEI